jgi:hypothetical protein
MKVARLSALCTGRLISFMASSEELPQWKYSMIRDVPVCEAGHQPNAPPRAHFITHNTIRVQKLI